MRRLAPASSSLPRRDGQSYSRNWRLSTTARQIFPSQLSRRSLDGENKREKTRDSGSSRRRRYRARAQCLRSRFSPLRSAAVNRFPRASVERRGWTRVGGTRREQAGTKWKRKKRGGGSEGSEGGWCEPGHSARGGRVEFSTGRHSVELLLGVSRTRPPFFRRLSAWTCSSGCFVFLFVASVRRTAPAGSRILEESDGDDGFGSRLHSFPRSPAPSIRLFHIYVPEPRVRLGRISSGEFKASLARVTGRDALS